MVKLRSRANLFFFHTDNNIAFFKTVSFGWPAGHYSSDDSRVLYETPHSARGDYLRIRNTDGSFTAVSPKGEYGPKDWRPAASSTSSAFADDDTTAVVISAIAGVWAYGKLGREEDVAGGPVLHPEDDGVEFASLDAL